MIDTKRTLTNLHNQFPRFKMETLFKILDCIVDENQFITSWTYRPQFEPFYTSGEPFYTSAHQKIKSSGYSPTWDEY